MASFFGVSTRADFSSLLSSKKLNQGDKEKYSPFGSTTSGSNRFKKEGSIMDTVKALNEAVDPVSSEKMQAFIC